jgi:hypothetical protein
MGKENQLKVHITVVYMESESGLDGCDIMLSGDVLALL